MSRGSRNAGNDLAACTTHASRMEWPMGFRDRPLREMSRSAVGRKLAQCAQSAQSTGGAHWHHHRSTAFCKFEIPPCSWQLGVFLGSFMCVLALWLSLFNRPNQRPVQPQHGPVEWSCHGYLFTPPVWLIKKALHKYSCVSCFAPKCKHPARIGGVPPLELEVQFL